MSGTHFAFYCNRLLRNFYFVLLTATGFGCGVFTLQPKFRQPSYRTMRFLMYCFLGALSLHRWLHWAHRYGWEQLDQMMGVESFFGLGFINFSGAAIYAARIPERWFPRRFDMLGQSHNWMHLLVLTGALVRLSRDLGRSIAMEREHTGTGLPRPQLKRRRS